MSGELQLGDLVRRDATYADVCDTLTDDMDTLAAEIGHLHTFECEATGHIAARVAKARAAIDAANGGKRKSGPGGWKHWVTHNLPFGYREAKRYLRVARALKGSRVAPSGSLRSQLKALAAEEREQERKAAADHDRQNAASLAEVDASAPECVDPADLGKTDASTGDPTPPVVEDDAQATLRPLIRDLVACFQSKAGAVQAKGERLLAKSEGSEAEWLRRILGALADAEGYVVELGEHA